MSLLFRDDEALYAELAQQLVKQSAVETPQPTYAMAGQLYLAASGWLLLAVPNGLVRAIFSTIDEIGVELPPGKDGQPFNAHISVMRPEEIEQIGGADKITERGQTFHYNIGRLATVTPVGWEEMSKCWLLQVSSPELSQLRRSYGLSPLPQRNNESLAFHITVAVRRKGVLRANEISKVSTYENGRLPDDESGCVTSAGWGDPDGDLVHVGRSAVLSGVAVKVSGSLAPPRSAALAGPLGARQSDLEGAACGDGGARTKGASGTAEVLAQLEQARKDTETNPSEAQREAGNYPKGKFRWKGLEISLENPKGSTRSGVSPDGKEWSTTMAHDYGYIRGTESRDGEGVDVFIGPHLDSELVVVVNQVRPQSGAFDELKVMLGFISEQTARDGYLANYDDGWKGLGDAVVCTLNQFKDWLDNGNPRAKFRLAKEKQGSEARATWPAETAGVSDLVADEGPLSQSSEQAVSALRWAGDHSLRKLAEFLPGFLSGCGAATDAEASAGAAEQRQELRAEQLLLGDLRGAVEKQAEQSSVFFPWSHNDFGGLGEDARVQEGHVATTAASGMGFCCGGYDGSVDEVLGRSQVDKEAAPVLQRAFSAQLASPTWNKNDDLFTNLLTNAAQVQDRGREMIQHRHNANALAVQQNPDLGYEQLRSIFAGEQQPGLDPVDQLAFGSELA